MSWTAAAPAVITMLVVTAYPLGKAVYLSLFSYRLTDPSGREFVGLSNYGVVLTDPLWWQSVVTTLAITIFSVSIEFPRLSFVAYR